MQNFLLYIFISLAPLLLNPGTSVDKSFVISSGIGTLCRVCMSDCTHPYTLIHGTSLLKLLFHLHLPYHLWYKILLSPVDDDFRHSSTDAQSSNIHTIVFSHIMKSLMISQLIAFSPSILNGHLRTPG